MSQLTDKDRIIHCIKNEIDRLRENVRCAGDDADKVYIGEDIGQLEVAKQIIQNHDF